MESAIHDFPDVRIADKLFTHCHTIGTITTISRQVFLGVSFKRTLIRFVRKDIRYILMNNQVVSIAKFQRLMRGASRTLFVMPESVDFADLYRTPGQARLAAVQDRLSKALSQDRIVERIGGESRRSAHHTGDPPFPLPGVTRLDFYSVNPIILLVSGGGGAAGASPPAGSADR